MTVQPRRRVIRDVPAVYREVEEYGVTRIVLMQRVSVIETTPAYIRPVIVSGDPLTFAEETVPSVTRGWWEWQRVPAMLGRGFGG